jgi:hypothetical protein
MRFVVNDMALRQVSLEFFVVRIHILFRYYSYQRILRVKPGNLAKQCSSGYREALEIKIFFSTQEKSFDLEGLVISLSLA